jgi:hypothetical protein
MPRAQDEAARHGIFGDSASAFSSQYVMPILGYIVVTVATWSPTCSRFFLRR